MLPLFLEVMDKEPRAGVVWLVAVGLGGCGFWLARWRAWTIVPSALAIVILAGSVWSEWSDPEVGPAMRAEAGEWYGGQVAVAATLAILATLLGRRQSRVDSA